MRWLLRNLALPALAGLAAGALVVLAARTPWQDFPEVLRLDELTPQAALDKPLSYADAVARAAPSVVNIYTTKVVAGRAPPFADPLLGRMLGVLSPQRRLGSSLGSGVIVTADGLILTNHHVVKDAETILILLHDGREGEAEVVGVDPETDLAVLRTSLPDLSPIAVGNPRGARVGDVVLAIGNPFGVGQSVSQGIISALGRGLGLNALENFIQTDAAINPGNSGGALVDAYGNLLGINSAILGGASVGVGFAIPADIALRVMEDLVAHGRVIRGWLGVQAQQLPPAQAERLGLDPPRGLLITAVHPASPAAAAGLAPGDVILKINGRRVGDGREGTQIIAGLRPGSPIELEVLRGGERFTTTAVAGERPSADDD